MLIPDNIVGMKILAECNLYVIMGWYVKKKGDRK